MNIRRRVGLPRMSFHVMNRGARRAVIFAKDGDRRVFVDLLGRFCLKHEIKLTSWCLMPNHYHTEPNGEGTPLSRMMHDLDGSYARFFNETYEASGCLFQGPFKSMSIDSPQGLVYVSRYIHLNPRDLGEDPIAYPWSSCQSYLGLAPVPPWLDPSPVLRRFGDSLEVARENYRFYLSSAPPRRRKTAPGEDPVDDYLVEYIGHLEELWSERCQRLGWPPRTLQLAPFICWYANRMERIPFRVLKEYYDYATINSVRVIISKFGKRLKVEEDLAGWASRVNVQASPQH